VSLFYKQLDTDVIEAQPTGGMSSSLPALPACEPSPSLSTSSCCTVFVTDIGGRFVRDRVADVAAANATVGRCTLLGARGDRDDRC
jgi:hypothetical protein